ncbi:MAG: AAA family ATPase [Betaproteobacteria bacterium]|nr:AAA family ATPase [Betaproteobacteria bacterium]
MPRQEALLAQQPLIAALCNPAVFGGDCAAVEVVETHISWVLLTGTYAYKVKKAVTLSFLDFGSLAARQRCCEEELRLNRRLAPSLYVDVVAITGSSAQPVIGGPGPAIEYAVRMREFPQSALLSRIAARGELVAADIDALAATVANFHQRIAVAPPNAALGGPDEILRYADDNFVQILATGEAGAAATALAALREWTRREHARLHPLFSARRRRGFVRECHGDLHLANVARIDGEITVFDGIEYSAALRWIDVASEIAFTVMDLKDRGQAAFAHRFLDAYLEATGDYEALAVLRYYVVYRALVRAKVACLRAGQLPPGGARDALHREFRDYVDLAVREAEPGRAAIVITHGFAGSGKTTCTQALLEALGAIRLRSDVLRKRRFGLGPHDDSGSGLASGLYAPEATRATYLQARDLAREIAASDRVAIVDATCLARWQRDLFRDLAAELRIPFAIVDLHASAGTLRQRVVQRRTAGDDASEADLAVLEQQQRVDEALADDELPRTLTVDAEGPAGVVSATLLRGLADLCAADAATEQRTAPPVSC